MPIQDQDSADGIGRCKMIPTQTLAQALSSTLSLTDSEIIHTTQALMMHEEIALEFSSQKTLEDFLRLISPYQIDHHILDVYQGRVFVVFNFGE
jgi:D-serine dehydratase